MPASDADNSDAPQPPPHKAPTPAFHAVARDSKLAQLIRKQQQMRDQQQEERQRNARAEANDHRFAAMDNPPKGKGGKRAAAVTIPRKSPGTLTWLVEGPVAFGDAPAPTKKHTASLKNEGFSIVGVSANDNKIARDWTYEQCVEYLKEVLPKPYAGTMAALEDWKAANPDHDDDEVPPVFRVLSRDGRKLSVTHAYRPTGLDMQEAITSASNWYERKLFITSGVDTSMNFDDEISIYRPCALKDELSGIKRESEDGSTHADDDEDESDDAYEEPGPSSTTGKRKRAAEAPVTRAMKRQRASSHISISDDDAPAASTQPVAGPSSIKAPAVASTFAATGFPSPPKRDRTRAV